MHASLEKLYRDLGMVPDKEVGTGRILELILRQKLHLADEEPDAPRLRKQIIEGFLRTLGITPDPDVDVDRAISAIKKVYARAPVNEPFIGRVWHIDPGCAAEDQAIELFKVMEKSFEQQNLGEKQMDPFLIRLIAALGIDAPENLAQENELIERIKTNLVDDAVNEALISKKILSTETEWARDIANKNLAVFKAFVKYRKQIEVVPDRPGATVPPDEIQKSINRQMGVSDSLFMKYNPARSGS